MLIHAIKLHTQVGRAPKNCERNPNGAPIGEFLYMNGMEDKRRRDEKKEEEKEAERRAAEAHHSTGECCVVVSVCVCVG